MAEISQITLPSGNTYDIKDAWARTQIEAITGGSAVVFIGVSTTIITDGGTETPTIAGWSDTVSTGNIVFYGKKEFIWGADSKWHELGDVSTGEVEITVTENASGNYTPAGTITGATFTGSATTSTGSYTPEGTVSAPTFTGSATTSTGTFTPAGTISTPTITVTPTTKAIDVATAETVTKTVVAVAPSGTAPQNPITYYSVSNEVLSLYQLGYTTGDSITTTQETVATGITSAVLDSAPVFTGTEGSVSVEGTPTGTVSAPTFTGTQGSVSVEGTPTGSVSGMTFAGVKVQIDGTLTE